jgi:hypothetical protein
MGLYEVCLKKEASGVIFAVFDTHAASLDDFMAEKFQVSHYFDSQV